MTEKLEICSEKDPLEEEKKYRAIENKAASLLTYRIRTVKQLRKKLLSIYGEEETDKIDSVILKFEEYGFLNDKDYTATYLRHTKKTKPMGVHMLKQDLYRKGVPKEVYEPILAEIGDEEYLEMIEELIIKKRRSKRDSESEEQFKNRVGAFLYRRGFSYELIQKAFSRIDFTTLDNGCKTV